ncbi:MAG TPA: diguanylate cyclase [Chloroflexota bacterium]
MQLTTTAAAALERRGGEAELTRALTSLWIKFKTTNLERVECLERAAACLHAGKLDERLRGTAEREAHKLAGAAGSFGFIEGSRLAREAETMLHKMGSDAARLSEIVRRLRTELQGKPRIETMGTLAETSDPCLLIVDDDRELVERLIIEAQAHGITADGAHSVAEARAAIKTKAPDAVLLDLTFGDADDDALTLLGELASRTPAVPVLVLTARTGLVDRVAVARLGATAYLQKPVAPSQVIEAATQVLMRERAVEERILAVDDDPLVLEMLRTLLTPRGYRVTTVSDPLKFWDVLEESPPDLLLLDVDMPGLSGIELCRAVRTDLRWAGVPVLFLTGMADPVTIQQIFAAGADDYVSKPIVGPELTTRVANRLERTQLHRRLAETDVLTGLGNRQKSSQSLAQLMRLSERHGKPVSLAVIDLDHFKLVNDQYGHSVGDVVLRRVAEVLSRTFRRDDVIGRWGGEEFVVGMYGAALQDGVTRIARALEAVQAEEFGAPDGRTFHVTFSAGVAEYPSDGSDLHTLFKAADAALYQAKGAGRSNVLAA